MQGLGTELLFYVLHLCWRKNLLLQPLSVSVFFLTALPIEPSISGLHIFVFIQLS
jgi:hypothetical protein